MANFHSPEGFFVYANSYKRAAETLVERAGSEMTIPTIYLLTHALELSLKSILLSAGHTARTLSKRPYHHDVSHCLAVTEELGLLGPVMLSAAQRETVAIASKLFSNRELSYFYERQAALPDIELLQSGLGTILAAVYTKISEPYFRSTSGA